jgi:imidazolonepropionase-like amidohydrolase
MRKGCEFAWFCFVSVVIILVGISAWIEGARAEGGEPPYFAITNARIVPVSGAVIESGTVVVAKGVITAVGADAKIPPEAWVIDGKGLTVYPGLIDADTTIGLPQPAPQESAGAGRGGRRALPPSGVVIRDPEDRPQSTPWLVAADELDASDKRIEQWRNAGFTTVLSAPDAGILPGQGSVIDLAGERAGDYVVKAQATLLVSLRPSRGFAGFPDSLMGTIAYVRQVFDDARWYEGAERVYNANEAKYARLRYDRTEQVVARALETNEAVMVPANNSTQILRGLQLIHEWKIPGVLYGAQMGYDVTEALAAAKRPVLVSLKWPEQPKDADPDDVPSLRELRFRDRAPSTPAALAKAGVKFAFYSDGVATPKDISKDLKKALDAGLAPDAALRALTLDAAEILGVGKRLGSIEPGKIANLVVTDGDIFSEKTKVKDVFVDGRFFEGHPEAAPERHGDHAPPASAAEDDNSSERSGAGVDR